MKPKTAVVLLVLLAACAAFLLIRNAAILRPSRGPTDANRSDLVFGKAPGAIARVVLSPAEGPRLVLAKQEGQWRIEEPFRAKADSYKVEGLVDAVARCRFSRSFAPGEKGAVDPSITSLNKPLWTVELTDEKGAAYRLSVGRPLPLRPGETYVQPGGQNRGFVALADLAETLGKPARDYRDKTLIRFNTAEVVALGLSGREVRGPYELQKQKDEWGILKPFSARAEKDAVRDILGELSYLSASSFVTDEPGSLAAYGLEEGQERLVVRVTVQPEANVPGPAPATTSSAPATAFAPASGPAPKVYAIAFGGRTDDKVYARIPGEPAICQVSASVPDNLLRKLEGLRSNTILEFDPSNVSAIDLSLPDGNVSLAKEPDRWMMKGPVAGKAGARAVADLLGKLSGLKAQSWAAPQSILAGAAGLEKPYASLTLRLAGTDQTTGLLVGASLPTGQTYVKNASAASVALVRSSETIPLLAPGATYWDPEILSLPYDLRVSRLLVARRDNTFALAGEEGEWKLSAPIEAPADEGQVSKVLRDLSSLNADKVVYLGPEVPQKYAKAVHNLTVEVYGRKPAPQASTAPTSAPTSAAATMTAPAPASAPASIPITGPAAATTTASAPATSQPATAASRPATLPAMGPETLAGRIQIVKVDGKAYAWVLSPGGTGFQPVPATAPATGPTSRVIAIGEFPASLYDDLAAELRQRTVWRFEPNDVIGVRLLSGADRLELRREGSDWVNALNPQEQADPQKVLSFLGDLKDLSVERFLTYKTDPADANKLGLSQPWATLEVRLTGGKTLSLSVSARGQDQTENRYASANTLEGALVLPSEFIGKLAKRFADFQKTAPKPEGVQ